MSVIVIDPTARNLPEQVLKNTQNIAELQSAIDKLAEDLPDIMGRSPALYKEVVALTTPDAPTGSFNLDFSKTSYNVKNGDFVFAVFSNGATFNSYVGLLSVTNDTAGSGIYSASVLSVTPNLKGNKGDTGATGPQGQPGEPGKPALWCNTIITGSEPLAGGSCNLGSNYFSRTPENGEKFLALWQNTNDSNHPYFVNLQIASDTSPYTCNILYVSDIKGPQGPAGESEKLYRHRIKINATAALWPEIYTEIINTSETPFDIDSLTSLIEGKQQVANGIATGTEPLFPNSVLYIYSNNSVLYAKTASLSDVAFERQNIAITDTVEEI